MVQPPSTPRSPGKGTVVSFDPLYQFSADDIRARISETYAEVMEQMQKNKHEYTWTTIKSLDELGRLRQAAMEEFLLDYPLGVIQERYVEGNCPACRLLMEF